METKTVSKRKNRTAQSPFFHLEKQVKEHVAWQKDLSLTEAAVLLKGHSPYTFVLSSGFDRYHYILSYVSDNGGVKHKNVRIAVVHGQPCFLNGGCGGPCSQIDDLIYGCLKTSPVVCKPLV